MDISKLIPEDHQPEKPAENPGIDLLPQSYLLRFRGSSPLEVRDASEKELSNELVLYTHKDGSPKLWIEHESGDYLALLDGHFYLDATTHTSPLKNLDMFLTFLIKHGVDEARQQIGGGLFNLFLLHRPTNTLTVINGMLGLSPAYFLGNSDAFMFSNNQLNFLGQSVINQTAIFEFLKYGYLPVSPSLFQDVDRLQPGERLELTPSQEQPVRTTVPLPEYPVRNERESDLAHLVMQWSSTLLRFFKRIQSRRVLLELGGDYTSRVIAAQVQHLDPRVINIGEHFSQATTAARDAAKGRDFLVFFDRLPQDAVKRNAGDLRVKFRTMHSIEELPVLHLTQHLFKENSELMVEGLLGENLLGARYFSAPPKGLWKRLSYLRGVHNFDAALQTESSYVDQLYQHGANNVPDGVLTEYFGQSHVKNLHGAFRREVDVQVKQCKTDADLLERLLILTHGRNAQGARVVALQTHAQVMLPFLDRRVFELGQSTPRKPRFAYELYNRLIIKQYPEVAHVPMPGTSGIASDTPFMFRLKTLLFRKPASGSKSEYAALSELEEQLQHSETRELMEQVIARGSRYLPFHVQQKIRADFEVESLDPLLTLRYFSLLLYLEDPPT